MTRPLNTELSEELVRLLAEEMRIVRRDSNERGTTEEDDSEG